MQVILQEGDSMNLNIDFIKIWEAYSVYIIIVGAIILFWVIGRFRKKKEKVNKMNSMEENAFRSRMQQIRDTLDNRQRQEMEEIERIRVKFKKDEAEMREEYMYLYNKLQE